MKQTFRALSPKRAARHARPASFDEESDVSPTGGSGGASPSFSLAGRAGSRSRPHRSRRRRVSAPTELPEPEKSDEDFKRDWGISREREEILLVEFRKQIEATVGPLKPVFDRYYLRRYLRARQHDLVRAKAMFLAHLKWREEFGLDNILTDFHFDERDAFLSLYPQGYHKTDKMGRPVYIQHIGAIKIKALQEITTEDRMIRFHVQEYERCLKYIFPACSKKAGYHIDQTFAIMDVKGVGLKHLTGDVKSILSRITSIDQNNYPETLGKTIIINAPAVFKMIWSFVRPMLDVRTQAKIEVAPSDYLKVLLKYIDAENIPEYLGGQSKGSLIDDVGPWKDPELLAAVEADIARREQQAAGLDAGLTADSMDLEMAGSSGPVPPSPTPSHLQQLTPLSGSSPMAGAPPSPLSPFEQHATGAFPQHPSTGLTDSEVDDFQDARSRRQSILSSSGSSAYMSGEDDGAEFYTPKHGDMPQGGSGFSFHSDRPLLPGSAGAGPGSLESPEPVAGVEAVPPPPSQQQQQAVRYSHQYPSSPEQQQAAAAAGIPAARRGQRPSPLAVPAEAQTSSEGGQEVSFGSGVTAQTAATHVGTPSSVTWSPSKSHHHHPHQLPDGMPAPPLQIPILARVRALEEKLPDAERPLRKYLPPGGELPSKAVGQGTLLHRVEALEKAMDTLLRAQDTALDAQRHRASTPEETPSGCSGCCCIM